MYRRRSGKQDPQFHLEGARNLKTLTKIKQKDPENARATESSHINPFHISWGIIQIISRKTGRSVATEKIKRHKMVKTHDRQIKLIILIC